jgi:DNA-binding transcriptional LysR family regulator
MFDWNDLRYFLAVARHGSTIAAAKSLRLSQSTVHRRLAELEKRIGRHVVIRHATGYRPTEFGAELRPLVDQVEKAVNALERYLAAADEKLTGAVRVTCSESIGYRLVRSQLLETFQRRHPGMRVELLMSDQFLDIAKGEADIAIRAGIPNEETLVGRKIADVPWALYGSRAYLERNGRIARIEDIAAHAVIGFDGDIREHHAAKWLKSVAPSARIVARSNTVPGLLMSVRSGAGLAPLPIPLAMRDTELERGRCQDYTPRYTC